MLNTTTNNINISEVFKNKSLLIKLIVFLFLGIGLICCSEILFPLQKSGNAVMLIWFCLLYALCVIFFTLDKRFENSKYIIIISLVIIGGFILRYSLLDLRSNDYNVFLSKWVDFYRQNDGFSIFHQKKGDYNVPYLYFICSFSYMKTFDLYLIKLLSVVAEVFMAIYAVKIVSIFNKKAWVSVVTFTSVLLLPTVWMNSAWWGQCDALYSVFIIACLYYALSDKPIMSMIMISLAFTFKLQTIFFFPMIIVFILTKRYKWWHIAIFPVTYIITILPALIMGKSFMDTLSIYTNQAQQYSRNLTMNASSFYALIKSPEYSDALFYVGILLTVVFLVAGCIFTLFFMKKITNNMLITLSLICVIGLAFFLPAMHDRYFFIAEILAVIFVCLNPRYFYVSILVTISSMDCYFRYLFKFELFSLQTDALLMFFALIILFAILVKDTRVRLKSKCCTKR